MSCWVKFILTPISRYNSKIISQSKCNLFQLIIVVYPNLFCNDADEAASSIGVSLNNADDKLRATSKQHNSNGPNIAPSGPRQKIPPAIASPVK